MLQTLLIWAVFANFLPPPTSQTCFKANESQCRHVDFAPGSILAGEGFDITTLQRKGAFALDMSSGLQKDKSCTLCKNPYMRGQMQKLPVSVVDWRPSKKCTIKLSSSVYQSSEALVNASTSSIENNWQSDLQLIPPKDQESMLLAGSNSKLAKYSMEKTKEDKFIFTRHAVSCGYYGYSVSSHPLLHPELNNEFESLPETYDESTKHLYYKLIDKFGTHYITKVTLGGEVHSVTSIRECQASLEGLSVDEVKMYLGQVIPGNDLPKWNRDFNLGIVDLTQFSSVNLEVWDKDSDSDDDLLGRSTVKLNSGVEENVCALYYGMLYYKVQVTCNPHLTGPSCLEYNPSPMEAQLEKLYISRNAHLIPRGMMLEMGVLLDECIPRFNQSNIRKAKGLEL
ncbi:perforin-1-like [Pangasianodon hypophthalmus]|uniref:perforin-1-like n=1 Tax=Pangasianodon hypophthalmus TaxID=310915 RepID=UPI002307B1DA|nr:perforin-1-like [Pangasianodon hypophthalmus]